MKHPIKPSTTQGNTSNTFEALKTETESEDNNKEQNTSEAKKTTTEPKTKTMEKNPQRIILLNEEAIEGVDEDSEMLISDIGSDEMEINDILEQEGVNLPDMVQNWKKKGMEHISEEEVRRINEILIARQRAEIDMQSKNLGVAKGIGL